MNTLALKNNLIVAMALFFAGTAYGCQAAAAGSSGRIAGIYSGAITYYRFPGPVASKPKRLFGAIGKDGLGYFISTAPLSSEIQVFRHLAGSGAIISPEYEVPTEGQTVGRGVQKWKIEIRLGRGSGRSSRLLGKFNRVDGYAALELREVRLTGQHMPLTSRSGAYSGFDGNRHRTVNITLKPDGRFSGTNASGCGMSGRLTRLGERGLFNVRMMSSGPSACRTVVMGVAFFDTRDRTGRFSGAGSYLYLIGTNQDLSHGIAMVLMRRRP